MLSGEPPSWKVDFGKLEDGTQDILDVGIGEFRVAAAVTGHRFPRL